MSGFISLIARIVALGLTIIITGLIGNVIARDVMASAPARAAINFTMFAAAASWLACIYGIAGLVVAGLARPAFMVLFDAVAFVAAFVAAVVLAARLGHPDCSATWGRLSTWIAYGSRSAETRCREIQAADAFLWFLCATLAAALFFSLRLARDTASSAARGARPPMMQV